MKPANVRVVVSGSAWMGGSLGSVESSLYRLFEQAGDEVIFVVYRISGGPEMIFEQIKLMLQRGIRIRMIINRFAEQYSNVQDQFRRLQQDYPHLLELKSFEPAQDQADLHAKIIVVDRQQALVSSANLSLRGLINNHELGIVVEGAVAAEIARAIDILMASPYAMPVD